MTARKKNMTPEKNDPEEIPDTSTPYWQKTIDPTPVTRGRPRIPEPKLSTTLRLDADILQKFKEGVPGWQTRINDVLKEYLAKR